MNKPYALLLVLPMLSLAVSQASGDDLLDRFRKEYPVASEKFEQAYSHSRAVGTYTRSKGTLLYKEVFDEARREPAVRDISTYLQSNLPTIRPGCMAAGGGTAQKFFDISRLPGEPNYSIDDFGPDDHFNVDSRVNVAPLFAVYCAQEYRVRDLLTDPKTTLISAKAATLGTQSVVEVDCTITGLPQGAVSRASIVFLQPSWAIKNWHFSIEAPDSPGHRTYREVSVEDGTVEYSALSPIPKVSKFVRLQVASTGAKDQMSWEVSNLQFVDIPEAQFELSAFGLKEPPQRQ